MPITVPAIDSRKYQDLRDEALRRIPVHNPEWTNFNRSDPGVTLVEVFAFLTESLLYRANQIPERNRRRFLKLLGVPLAAASDARGIVAFSNDRGPLAVTTLPAGFPVAAGQTPFRVDQGLDVLPVEGHLFYKREVRNPPAAVRAYYDQLYSSFLDATLPASARLYESVPLTGRDGIDFGSDTVDGSVWLALSARKVDVAGLNGAELQAALTSLRDVLAGKTLTFGVVPWLTDNTRQLTPGGTADPERALQLTCSVPLVPEDGRLPADPQQRRPTYRMLPLMGGDVLTRPGTVQVTLPDRAGLRLWLNIEPLEAGVGEFPPAIEDAQLEARVVTWLRFSVPPRTPARILWAGINAAMVSQRARVTGERLPDGTGAPDQSARLAMRPVLPGSVRLFVRRADADRPEEWRQVDDLIDAGAEVPVPDPRQPPGSYQPKPRESRVFSLDAEAGELRFGDGARGTRPPLGASLIVEYDYSEGREGNVNAGAIRTGPTLPPGFGVTNPVGTWGGADAETVEEGEKQVPRTLQHRDRLVTAEDFATITWRTPGVELGRVDVIPASSPELGENEPGDAPGAVTLMVIPRHDPVQPDAPRPDRLFLDAICTHLDPRRLVTTEVFLKGPTYRKIWLSLGIDVASEQSIAEVRQAVEQALRETLAPLPAAGDEAGSHALLPVFTRESAPPRGWPLRKPVVALELAAVVARVPGVTAVREFLLAGEEHTTSQNAVAMKGLELPRVAGIMVGVGAAVQLGDMRGRTGSGGPATGDTVEFVPVPVVPEEC
jgi:hypothetical protein